MNPQHAALLHRHLEAENAHDLDGTLATLHPDCLFEDHATGQVWRGRDGAAAHYRQWWTTFDVTVSRVANQSAGWISDATYVAEATWTGSHIGEFLGVQPSGKAITQPFVVVVSFKDSLMDSERFHYDLASLLRQIGPEVVGEITALPFRDNGRSRVPERSGARADRA
jgi:steroid delta-isomerase-like uncharacterized protein